MPCVEQWRGEINDDHDRNSDIICICPYCNDIVKNGNSDVPNTAGATHAIMSPTATEGALTLAGSL